MAYLWNYGDTEMDSKARTHVNKTIKFRDYLSFRGNFKR